MENEASIIRCSSHACFDVIMKLAFCDRICQLMAGCTAKLASESCKRARVRGVGGGGWGGWLSKYYLPASSWRSALCMHATDLRGSILLQAIIGGLVQGLFEWTLARRASCVI